ncbi:MAG TPA: aminodeoxychorismate synthase component I [Patescibacteria group bacterium]|nr:aminodeoxychorismate synthase component I [Patescibacteria group bacterium]
MNLYAFSLEFCEPVDLFTGLHAMPYSLFFDSADRNHSNARYSFIAFEPTQTITAKNGTLTITNAGQQRSFQGNPFSVVKERLASLRADVTPRADLPPFQGGAAGFFGYDLAYGIERLPSVASGNAPDMAIGIYDQVAAFDHQLNKVWFIALAESEEAANIKHAHFLHLTQKRDIAPHSSFQPEWTSSFTRAAYEQAIARIVEYIRAGDIFQANLSQRFSAQLPAGFDSFSHYRALRRVNTAPFAAYMNFGKVKLSSASPERFLSVDDNGHVETKPIKGTRPRAISAREDERLRRELAASVKDRAENIMIVDLLRNDLSKVCQDFSVEVPALCALESFATVHHLVSTVTGSLQPGQTAVDLLRACFPGGSITGAPKMRAMEIIAELENMARGPYCGAMGYIGFDGAMDTSIAIRTLVYEGDTVSFNVGGGVTANSDPAEEYQETLDKAAAMFASFGNKRREAA